MPKYKNKKIEVDGHKFDSLREAKRFTELSLLWRSGEIIDLKIKPTYDLTPKNNMFRKSWYEADFSYKTKKGDTVVEDVKPEYASIKAERKYKATQAYKMFKLKQKLMYHYLGILVLEV